MAHCGKLLPIAGLAFGGRATATCAGSTTISRGKPNGYSSMKISPLMTISLAALRRSLLLLGVVATAFGATAPGFAATSTNAETQNDSALSLQQALNDLASQRYAQRQAASQAVERALAKQMQDMLNAAGPERQARIRKLLDFNIYLSRWAKAIMHMPPSQQQAMLQWGLQPNVLRWVGRAFSSKPADRAAATHPLANIPGPQSDWILEKLLADSHRQVYLNAMSAIWDRKPTAEMVRTLWLRAVLLGITPMPMNTGPVAVVNFRGQRITLQPMVNFWMQIQDGPLAARELVHWHPKLLATLIVSYLKKIALEKPGFNQAMPNVLATPSNLQARSFQQLFLLYKPKEAVPYLLRLVHQNAYQNVNFSFNNKPQHWSNRTEPLYLLTIMAGWKPAQCNLHIGTLYGGIWITSTLKQEDDAIKKITAWFKAHGQTAAPDATQTRPLNKPPFVVHGATLPAPQSH